MVIQKLSSSIGYRDDGGILEENTSLYANCCLRSSLKMKIFHDCLSLLLVFIVLENSGILGFSLSRFVIPKWTKKTDVVNINAITSSAVNQLSDSLKLVPTLDKVKAIDDDEFNVEVLSHAGLSVVVFTSSWCGPCKAHLNNMDEVLNSQVLAKKGIKFLSVDTDENPVSSTEFQVRSIPSTMLFKNGRCVSIIDGAVPKHVIEAEALKHALVNLPDVSVSTFE